jgi:hypothetical protein
VVDPDEGNHSQQTRHATISVGIWRDFETLAQSAVLSLAGRATTPP